MTLGCPQCEEEREQARKQEEREREERLKLYRVEEAIKKAGIPPRFIDATFDNYKAVSDKQKMVLTRCREYAASLSTGNGSLFLCGSVGTGKTHLACAVLIDYIKHEHQGQYISVMKMIREIRSTYSKEAKEDEQDAIDRFTKKDLLVLDEVGVQLGTDSEKLLLFEVINGRYERMKPTVLISNLNVKDVTEYLGERTIDRLRENGGKVLGFTWESHRKESA
jgi:DNA replication protein DnaC